MFRAIPPLMYEAVRGIREIDYPAPDEGWDELPMELLSELEEIEIID